MVLLVCSLVALTVLVGMVIAVVPLGWAPLFGYSCVGLVCAWILYRRTVKPESKPVGTGLLVQCGFMALVALVCFVLGQFGSFGLHPETSQVAALPLVYFLIMALRRSLFSTDEAGSIPENTGFSKLCFVLGYLWLCVAVAFVLISMAGTLISDLFVGVSLLVSPLNPISWLIFFLWFLPAFLLLGLGRASRKARPY